MAGKNQRKVVVLIGTAMGMVMGIYWKTLQAIRRDVVPEPNKAQETAVMDGKEDEERKPE